MRAGIVLGIFIQLVTIGAARAGDVAELEILGFSADGGVFAFEEYGIGDGSGFPYATRYYIDTSEDKFLPGTPIRVRLEDENATLAQARAEVRQKGEKIVGQAELDANRGFTAGFNPVTEYSADPHRIVVNPRPIFHPVDPPMEFRLEELPMNDSEPCNAHGEINGFRLLRIEATDGGQTEVLHADKSIPKSRGCPYSYSIGGVQTLQVSHTLTAYAVMIAVQGYGFEGPDYHWIAVTRRWW
jgi:predicted secreted protein